MLLFFAQGNSLHFFIASAHHTSYKRERGGGGGEGDMVSEDSKPLLREAGEASTSSRRDDEALLGGGGGRGGGGGGGNGGGTSYGTSDGDDGKQYRVNIVDIDAEQETNTQVVGGLFRLVGGFSLVMLVSAGFLTSSWIEPWDRVELPVESVEVTGGVASVEEASEGDDFVNNNPPFTTNNETATTTGADSTTTKQERDVVKKGPSVAAAHHGKDTKTAAVGLNKEAAMKKRVKDLEKRVKELTTAPRLDETLA